MRVLSFDLGTRNLAYALVESPDVVVKMGMIDLGKHAARQACDALVDTLMGDNAWMLVAPDEVVLELQPGSGVCKTLSHVIQAVFRMQGHVLGTPPKPVRFMPAGRKLKYDLVTLAEHSPTTYSQRKSCAVAMAEKVLARQEGRYLDFFRSRNHKQKTDLADALVQACKHLQENLDDE
jgi:hypothetical protein